MRKAIYITALSAAICVFPHHARSEGGTTLAEPAPSPPLRSSEVLTGEACVGGVVQKFFSEQAEVQRQIKGTAETQLTRDITTLKQALSSIDTKFQSSQNPSDLDDLMLVADTLHERTTSLNLIKAYPIPSASIPHVEIHIIDYARSSAVEIALSKKQPMVWGISVGGAPHVFATIEGMTLFIPRLGGYSPADGGADPSHVRIEIPYLKDAKVLTIYPDTKSASEKIFSSVFPPRDRDDKGPVEYFGFNGVGDSAFSPSDPFTTFENLIRRARECMPGPPL